MKRTAVASVAVSALAVAVLGCHNRPTTAPAQPRAGAKSPNASTANVGLNVGNVAPEIDGEDLDGQHFKLSDYRGKVVVLDFWGNW